MSARFLAVSAVAALTLTACGGGGETAEEAAPPAEAAPSPAPQATSPAVQLPDGVTPAMVEEGRTLFHGAGICVTCHGQNGVGGAQGLGPALGDAEWLHSDGSYDAIVNQINTGVPATQSKSGTIMPPKGGAVALTDAQVRAIAAYVYSLRGA